VGSVSVAFGTAGGISGATGRSLKQKSNRAEGSEAFDKCGQALGAADLDNDGDDELVMGLPW
jgi:hypothetical protein